jgi:ribosomal protein S18 acetylase RimI-like enzyme
MKAILSAGMAFCCRQSMRITMRYRLYQSADFAALYAVEELCFAPPFRFSRAYMRQLVRNANCATWIAEKDGELTGFAIVEWEQRAEENGAYIQTIEVTPSQRGQGIGGELLRRVEDSAEAAGAGKIWLHVDAKNSAAIRLYEGRGYERQGREERYYARHRAALVYGKRLVAS